MRNSTVSQKVAILATCSVLLILAAAASSSYAFGFNIRDFKIKQFGIHDQTPFLTVEGKAGGTKASNHNTILAYVFETNHGIYAVTSHFGKDTSAQSGPNDLRYHAHLVTLNSQNCITSITHNEEGGVAKLNGHTVKVLDTDATKVNKVLTARLTISDNHRICVDKVFDSKS
jgi:hypothetical protein